MLIKVNWNFGLYEEKGRKGKKDKIEMKMDKDARMMMVH